VRTEVLAPAGDEACMRAAIRAGADAVYFGVQGFNARARAANFRTEDLPRVFAELHRHGVKGFVTLNTLVFDDELAALEATIRACADAGADAVIVQDLGVVALVRAVAPGLPVHASTQMTCTDASSVRFAERLGAERVVVARELSVDDIAAITRGAPEVELEVFVHGALCVSYSGQCLTSEAIGGRSANRGACAQACRLPYDLVVDGVVEDLGERAYLLSPEDLEASRMVPQLAKLGVSSLKIEGRLKGPEYVASAVKLYRAAVDGDDARILDDRRADALVTYSRGSGPGFLAGVDHQRLVEAKTCEHRGVQAGVVRRVVHESGRAWIELDVTRPLARGEGIFVEGGRAGDGELGGRAWEVEQAREIWRVWLGPDVDVRDAAPGRRVFVNDDPAVERRVLTDIERAPHRESIDVVVRGRAGGPLALTATSARGLVAHSVTDAHLAIARERGLDEALLRDKLGRLGDTPYALGSLTIELGDSGSPTPLAIAPSSLNRARRALVDALAASAVRSHATTNVTSTALVDDATRPEPVEPANLDAHSGDAKPLASLRVTAAGSPFARVEKLWTDVQPRFTPAPAEKGTAPGLVVLCRTLAQAEAAMDAGADGVWLDFLALTGTGNAVRALVEKRAIAGASFAIGVAPPRIRKPGEERIDRFLLDLPIDALLVRSLGTLEDVRAMPRSARPKLVGDFSLNVANRLSARTVLGCGLDAFTPSFDLDAGQLGALLTHTGANVELVVHHPMPLFHTEHCLFAALLSDGHDYRSCGRPCESHVVSLRDRVGMENPVEADVGCRNTIFHARPQSAASVVPHAITHGVRRFRIELVRETASDVARLVRTYRALLDGTVRAGDALRTLNTEGGYGVVRGSLRILT
jgi:putative protease